MDNNSQNQQSIFNNYYGNQPAGSPTPNTPIAPVAASQPPKDKASSKNKKIIIITICIVAVLGIIGLIYFFVMPHNMAIGKWACHSYYSEDTTPTTKLELNKNGTYRYGDYNDLANNHYAGNSFEAKESNKETKQGETWYEVKFGPITEFIINGETQPISSSHMSDLEMVIYLNNNLDITAIATFEDTYSIYTCIKEEK